MRDVDRRRLQQFQCKCRGVRRIQNPPRVARYLDRTAPRRKREVHLAAASGCFGKICRGEYAAETLSLCGIRGFRSPRNAIRANFRNFDFLITMGERVFKRNVVSPFFLSKKECRDISRDILHCQPKKRKAILLKRLTRSFFRVSWINSLTYILDFYTYRH